MASSTRIPAIEVGGVVGTLVTTMSRRMLGKVPESLGVMWHHRAVLKDTMTFGRRSERWDRLDENLAVLAVMSAAATVGCSFCLDVNYFLSHRRGLDEAKVRQVPRWRESGAYTPVERRVMEYAEAMSQTPPAVSGRCGSTAGPAYGSTSTGPSPSRSA
jgi:alkylhydroperoxidase family enzyme